MITVFPDKFSKAYKGLPVRPGALTVGKSGSPDLLLDRYQTDAHFVCYSVPGRSGIYRQAKAAVSAYLDRPEDMPFMHMMAFDLDLPGHRKWIDGDHIDNELFLNSVSEYLRGNPDFFEGCGAYATRGGLRILVQLQNPVPVSHADSLLSQALDRISDMPGLDKTCKDWTRMFRVPYCLRDGEEQDWTRIIGPPTLPTAPTSWSPRHLVAGATPLPGREFGGDAPPLDTAPKRPTKTDLKGLDEKWMRILTKGYPLETRAGERHAAILECALALSSALGPKSPIEVFVPMQASLVAMGDLSRFWGEAWKLCCWVVGHSVAQDELVEEARREAAVEQKSFLSRLAEHMGCDVHRAAQSLLVWAGGAFWCLDPETMEYVGPYRRENLSAGLRDYLIEFTDPNAPASKVLADIGSVAMDLRYHYGGKSYLDLERDTLMISHANVVQPEPVFHRDVDRYLDLWALDDGTNPLKAWLSRIWDVDKACAALFLMTGPRTGKSLIATLVSGATSGAYVPFDELSGDFNSSLRKSWVVWADEGIEFNRKSPANVLRRLTGTHDHGINVKYQDATQVEGYLRVILTGNNDTLLRFQGALNEDDIHALAERVVFLAPTAEAQRDMVAYLQNLRDGYCRDLGIDPRAPKAPNYIEDIWKGKHRFLEHCAWLRDNYDFKRGRRFVVEGTESDWSKGLRTRHGVQSALVSVLCRACAEDSNPVVYLADGNVYVHGPSLQELWDVYSGGEQQPPSARITDGLRALSSGRKTRLDVPTSSLGRVNYWIVESKVLEEAGIEMGLSGADQIVRRAEATKTT